MNKFELYQTVVLTTDITPSRIWNLSLNSPLLIDHTAIQRGDIGIVVDTNNRYGMYTVSFINIDSDVKASANVEEPQMRLAKPHDFQNDRIWYLDK